MVNEQENEILDNILIEDGDTEDQEVTDDNRPENVEQDPETVNPRKLRVSIQDFGSGMPLPHYGANSPNAAYYASNITVNNFNVVDASTGDCFISLYEERECGKDGNAMCSLRYENTKNFLLANKNHLPSCECKILDNCVGQNKSNTTHKFSMLMSILFFPDGVNDIYFKVGHSHNLSDTKTAHAHKAMAKKNLYTPRMIEDELNKTKGLEAKVYDSYDGVFLQWKQFLDKTFPNMRPGFTSYYNFEFKEGVVSYKELSAEGETVVKKTQVFCANPEATRKVILRELYNLSSTSSPVEILKAKLRLPPLPKRTISQAKIDNMKVLYPQIPQSHRWFYPEGNTQLEDRQMVDEDVPVIVPEADAPQARSRRNGPGRPPNVIPPSSNQPGILQFLGSGEARPGTSFRSRGSSSHRLGTSSPSQAPSSPQSGPNSPTPGTSSSPRPGTSYSRTETSSRVARVATLDGLAASAQIDEDIDDVEEVEEVGGDESDDTDLLYNVMEEDDDEESA